MVPCAAERLGAARIEDPHDVLLAAERADGHAAADGLAHRRQVRLDAVLRLPAADVQAIGDRLVEDEQGAVLVGEPQGGADELRVAGLEDVAEDRLEEDRRDPVSVPRHELLEMADIVEAHEVHHVGDGLRDARRDDALARRPDALRRRR